MKRMTRVSKMFDRSLTSLRQEQGSAEAPSRGNHSPQGLLGPKYGKSANLLSFGVRREGTQGGPQL